jgi:hypothetical protein
MRKIERRERRTIGVNEPGRIKSPKGLLAQHANTPHLPLAPATPPPPPPPPLLLPPAAAPTSSRSPSPIRSASPSMSDRSNTSGKHPLGSETRTTPPSSLKGRKVRPGPPAKSLVKQFSMKPKHWATQLYRFGNVLGFPQGGSTRPTQSKRPPSRWYRNRADTQTMPNLYTQPHSPSRPNPRVDDPDVKYWSKTDGSRNGRYFEPTSHSRLHKGKGERQSETRYVKAAA